MEPFDDTYTRFTINISITPNIFKIESQYLSRFEKKPTIKTSAVFLFMKCSYAIEFRIV